MASEQLAWLSVTVYAGRQDTGFRHVDESILIVCRLPLALRMLRITLSARIQGLDHLVGNVGTAADINGLLQDQIVFF